MPSVDVESASRASVQAWPRYRDNVARHLIGISRELQQRLLSSLVEEGGFHELRPSFAPLLSLLWEEARPLTVIAEELAISSQACSQLANLAEAAGYLERRRNPEDGRSKVAMLTPRGRALVEQAVRVILEHEAQYAAHVGTTAYQRFTASLAVVYRGLEIPAHADPALTARAGRSVGVLPLIAMRIQQQLIGTVVARGHSGLKPSHDRVLVLIPPEGARIHEIARALLVSRQAISTTVRELEAQGYVERAPDPHDKRGVVLTLTARGEKLVVASVAAVEHLERALGEMLGASRLAQLERVARDLHHALGLDVELADPAEEARRPRDRSGAEIEQLASRLQRRLGRADAARLAVLLEAPGPRRASS